MTSVFNRISAVMISITIISFVAGDQMHKFRLERLNAKLTLTVDSLNNAVSERDSLIQNMIEINHLNWGNIDKWIAVFDIDNGDIVKSQIQHETGNLTSFISSANNNLFGMKHPGNKGRETTSLGNKNGYAYYYSYVQSIKDYAFWQKSRTRIDGESYYSFLVRVGYAEDSTYIQRLKYIAYNAFSD